MKLSQFGGSVVIFDSYQLGIVPPYSVDYTNRIPVAECPLSWKSDGILNVPDKAIEATRAGDDARLRIGLMINGKVDRFENPLAPKWIKQVRQTLKHPSSKLIYLIAGARHSPGQQWISPYDEKVTMISVSGIEQPDGWRQVSYRFAQPQEVVGLWIMADGDNTRSQFTTQLKKLAIRVQDELSVPVTKTAH